MTKMPISPPTRQDLMIFQGLQRALVEQKAFIKINFKRLNRFKSPFFNPWENVLPLLIGLLFSLALMISDNLVVGTVMLFMKNRVIKRVVPRIEKFLIAWRYGGISIVLAADPRYFCQAPVGDWRSFVENYFPDLIPQDTAEKKDDADNGQ